MTPLIMTAAKIVQNETSNWKTLYKKGNLILICHCFKAVQNIKVVDVLD